MRVLSAQPTASGLTGGTPSSRQWQSTTVFAVGYPHLADASSTAVSIDRDLGVLTSFGHCTRRGMEEELAGAGGFLRRRHNARLSSSCRRGSIHVATLTDLASLSVWSNHHGIILTVCVMTMTR